MKNEDIIYKRIKGIVESYICNRGVEKDRAVLHTKAGLALGGGISETDVENILNQIYEDNVKAFEGSTAYPTLFQERKSRFEIIKIELLNKKIEKDKGEALDNGNRNKEMKKEEVIVGNTLSRAKELKGKIKDNIQKEGEICSYLDGIEQYYTKKEELVKIGTPFVAKLDDHTWEQSTCSFGQDENLLKTLDDMKSEVDEKASKTDEWHTTAISGQIWATTGLVTFSKNLKVVVDPPIQKQIDDLKIGDITPDHINAISEILTELFSKDIAVRFDNIIHKWNSSLDDQKHAVLNELRNFIFDTIIKELDPNSRQYTQMPWFARYKGEDYKQEFTRVRFFILGYSNENDLGDSALKDIDAVCDGFKNCYHFMSIFGHKGEGKISDMENTYIDCISVLRRMLFLRKKYHKDKK